MPVSSIEQWFAGQGWKPLSFQPLAWQAYVDGESGLIHASTGTGKTYAAWLGFVAAQSKVKTKGIRALWITPLRALAEDTCLSLNRPLEAFGIEWRVEQRTGDTTASVKQRQLKNPPGALVTTPESVSLLLAQADSQKMLSGLDLVVVDEWHELMGSKRGTQIELALARLRSWNPNLKVWGLSATLGNMAQAAEVLGVQRLIAGEEKKEIIIDSLIPHQMERFPWAGHLGVQMMPRVAEEIEQCQSALVFTNTRAQAELWYQSLLMLMPELREQIAIHHGSIEKAAREAAEMGLRDGSLRVVVCTSSLDLGVDFSPVDRVFQVGSSKGIARLVQRAGRSGHRPGEASRITMAPTNGLELAEIAALRDALRDRRIEDRPPPRMPLDVLIQHLVTVALGGGFEEGELRREVQSTCSYRNLTDRDWRWCLDFVVYGGDCLKAYPDYHKVKLEEGRYTVTDRRIAMQHRMSIGTIVSDAMVKVAFMKGGAIGNVEESFAGRLRKGDRFIFAGKPLEFVMMKDLTCYVRKVSSNKSRIVRWTGSKMSLSIELSEGLRNKLDEAANGIFDGEEMQAARAILSLQNERSVVPKSDEFLIEEIVTREGHHLYFYPLDGRMVHEGLAALFSFRLSQMLPLTFTFSANDYGFELLSADPIPFDAEVAAELFSTENLFEHLIGSMNAAELSRRQFREIARVAGLVFQGYPGAPKTSRQVQASSGLIYDVFSQYEPDNPLVGQSTREVLERQLDESRMKRCLERMAKSRLLISKPEKPTPFAFPLLVSRLRETLSSEEVEDRVRKMIASLER
jgi:ATP-dependent helicase Lhr and Lhr-like helicase